MVIPFASVRVDSEWVAHWGVVRLIANGCRVPKYAGYMEIQLGPVCPYDKRRISKIGTHGTRVVVFEIV